MDTGSFNANGELDTSKGMILAFLGKKRSGKSVLALYWFRSFPGDKAVIDVAGDDGPMGPGVVEIRGTVEDLPRSWPEHLRPAKGVPMILRYVPDPKSPTLLEDIDCFLGMCYAHSSKEKPVAVLVHEMGVAAPAGKTKANTRAALMHNRHHGLNLFLCMPRALDVEKLVLYQTDLCHNFEMPSQADRDRVAETIGWDKADYTDALEELGPNEYLRFDANIGKPPNPPAGVTREAWEREHPDFRLIHADALPEDVVRETLEWAGNVPKHPADRW